MASFSLQPVFCETKIKQKQKQTNKKNVFICLQILRMKMKRRGGSGGGGAAPTIRRVVRRSKGERTTVVGEEIKVVVVFVVVVVPIVEGVASSVMIEGSQ